MHLNLTRFYYKYDNESDIYHARMINKTKLYDRLFKNTERCHVIYYGYEKVHA